MKTPKEIIPFPFLKISTILLSQGRLFNIIQVSKPLPFCACS